MVRPAASYVSYEDFLDAERTGDLKHEWLDGVVYAMAGGTVEHARLAANLTAALKQTLTSCEVFSSDVMLFVRATRLSTYADVVCGAVDSQKVERDGRILGEALLNPTVIVEVLSDSTEDYDRGEKFHHYMMIPSLQNYVLVSQDEAKIEVFRRPERGRWEHAVARAGETLVIAGRTIRVDDVYRRAG
ncbi:MAG TPA: Uma2 family endonuclease [Kofleriaceae bacterium]|jgi:Uma2 family endonuclease|nr:Uma2 family endonuclease [Kofleriaceae bacterium]